MPPSLKSIVAAVAVWALQPLLPLAWHAIFNADPTLAPSWLGVPWIAASAVFGVMIYIALRRPHWWRVKRRWLAITIVLAIHYLCATLVTYGLILGQVMNDSSPDSPYLVALYFCWLAPTMALATGSWIVPLVTSRLTVPKLSYASSSYRDRRHSD